METFHLQVYIGGHLNPPESGEHILGLHVFCDTELNFHVSYIDTDWGMRTVAFAVFEFLLMATILVYGMTEKLQRSCPEYCDELVDILGINLNWIMHLLSGSQRRSGKSQGELAYSLDSNGLQGGF